MLPLFPAIRYAADVEGSDAGAHREKLHLPISGSNRSGADTGMPAAKGSEVVWIGGWEMKPKREGYS